MSNTPDEKPQLSIVIPLFNEQESLKELFQQVYSTLHQQYRFEIIFVDDGSSDCSWEVITHLAGEYHEVRGLRFRRNYGKSSALQKGFELARGTWVVTIDADLQDDPAEIPEMIAMLENGYDLVSGWKKKRHDPVSKTIPSRFFNFVTSLATGIRLHDFNCGLKAYRHEVTEAIYLHGELHRYVPLLAHWQGFTRIGEKIVNHRSRKYGRSKFGLSRYIKGFLDLVTLLFVNSFIQRPMHFFGTIGTFFLCIGSILMCYLLVMRIFFLVYLSDRPLFLFSALLILVGLQFFSIGFLGEMLNHNWIEKRPVNIRDKI